MNNIYKKYCNSIQNHALGAYAIASFIEGYKKESNESPSLLHIFTFLPMVMNEDIRNTIKAAKGNGGIQSIDTFISEKVRSKDSSFSTLHNYIKNFREYTLTCFIFALRTGLIELSKNNELSVNITSNKQTTCNHIFLTSNKLGGLFGNNKHSLEKLLIATGVNL